MRKLHLVGLTTDRDGLIFTARKGSRSGGYIVPLNDDVLDAVAEARRGQPGGFDGAMNGSIAGADQRPGRAESSLTPREMQARLRAGRTIEEVAAEAGVQREWVARFAVPILAEQAQVVELARGLTYAKPRLGDSSQPLNASVLQNLSDKGVFLPDDLVDAGWSAFQLHDTVWMVRFRYRSRARDQEARWEIDVPTAILLARNRHASDLGYVEGAPHYRVPALDEDGEPDTAGGSAPRAAVTTRRPRPTTTSTSTAVRKRARTGAKSTSAVPVRAARKSAKATTPAKVPTKRAAPAKAPRPSLTKPPTVGAKAVAAGAKATTAQAGRAPARSPKPAPATASARSPKPGPKSARKPGPKPARKTAPMPARKTATAASRSAGARTAKIPAASDVVPAPGPGGARLAVAKVSRARVAASMATADRAPWAAAVRSRPGARPSPAVTAPRAPVDGALPEGSTRSASVREPKPAPAPAAPSGRPQGAIERSVPTFAPRALPDGVELEKPKARRPPRMIPPADGERSPIILPAPRVPATDSAAIPTGRATRRRLRSP